MNKSTAVRQFLDAIADGTAEGWLVLPRGLSPAQVADSINREAGLRPDDPGASDVPYSDDRVSVAIAHDGTIYGLGDTRRVYRVRPRSPLSVGPVTEEKRVSAR